MKVLAWTVGVVAVAVAALAAFAMMNLRALIGAHQDELVARVGRLVGRSVAVGSVGPSWWPLGIRLANVTVGEDPAFGAAPFLVADGIVMGIRPWPLVSGRIEASGVHLDRPRLVLVRDDDGRWNVDSLGLSAKPEEARARTAKDHRRGFRVPLEWIVGVALSRVVDGEVVIEDRRRAAPIVLRHVRLRATDVQLGATAQVRLEAALFAAAAPDVRLDLEMRELGQHDAALAPFTARLTLADADLGTLAGWLGSPGAARGRVRMLSIDAEGPFLQGRADVALEAVDPALTAFGVPIGRMQPLTVAATIGRALDRVALSNVRATLGTLALRADGDATLDPWRVTLRLTSEGNGRASLALDHAPLAIGGLDGVLALDREGLALQPLRFRVDDAPFELRGWITDGAPLTFDLHVEGRPFDGAMTAEVVVDGAGNARARVEAVGVDLATALPRFAPTLARRVEGRASGGAVLTGQVAAGRLSPGSLAGSGALTVEGGRLCEVNLPDLVVAEIERMPLMPEIVSTRTRAQYAELFGSRDTVIDSADLPFTVARGRFASDRAVLVSPAYQISGKGWIDATEEVRFTGTVLLGAAVSRTLRDDVRAAKYLAADDGRISLPFLARGRLGRVRVEPDGKRLRERGLTALLRDRPDAADAPRDRRDRRGREDRRPEDLEDQVIERLERMLKP